MSYSHEESCLFRGGDEVGVAASGVLVPDSGHNAPLAIADVLHKGNE